MWTALVSTMNDIFLELKLIRKALEERNKILKQIINTPVSDDLYLKSRDEYLKEIDNEFSDD